MPIIATASRQPASAAPTRTSGTAADAFRLLAAVGAGFFVMGLADIAFGWYPTAFGDAQWEFGTISGTLNALAIPVLGLFLLMASGMASGNRGLVKAAAGLMTLLLLAVLAMGVLYLTVFPIALRAAAPSAALSLAMKKGIAKALLLGSVNAVLLGVGSVRGWKYR